MKIISGFEATEGAISIIKKIVGKEMDLITITEIENVLAENNELVRAEELIFLEEEMEIICTYYSDYDNIDLFFIEELDRYIKEDCNGEYYWYYMNGLSDFADYFLNFINLDSECNIQEFYEKDLSKICWFDEENELYKKIQDELDIIENEEGESIIVYGYGSYIGLEESLRNMEEYKDCKYKEVGYFEAKKIYEINGKLYYIGEDSYVYNNTACWFLNEVSEITYKEFGYDNFDRH